jgi:hypothetical protein
LEEIVRQQPEYLVFASADAVSGAKQAEELRRRPGWRDLAAVRQHHLAIVSDAIDIPAPRLIAAVEQLARALHPEAFNKDSEDRKEKNENKQAPRTGPAPQLSSFLFPDFDFSLDSRFPFFPISNFQFLSSLEPCLCSR